MTETTIWKQELKPGLHTYALPKGAQILSVEMQRGIAQMWFLCSPTETEREPRRLLLTGTGHIISGQGTHSFIGTMMTENRTLVFHVFEVIG